MPTKRQPVPMMARMKRVITRTLKRVSSRHAKAVANAEALRWINHYAGAYGMIQIPVLPLPTPAWKLTHGLYCDEFAEYHTKDMAVRQLLGGFIPSS